MTELSHPNVLEPEAVLASVNPDEAAFAAQTVAYAIEYQNAHVRFASGWPDPARLRVAALPRNSGPGAPSTGRPVSRSYAMGSGSVRRRRTRRR